MKKSNIILILCTLVALVLALAACNRDDGGGSPVAPGTPAATPGGTPGTPGTPDTPGTPEAAQPRDIVRIEWLAGHGTQPIPDDDPVIAWLNETFDVEIVPWFLERANYIELLTLRITGGEIPDLWMMPDTSSFAMFVNQGVIMELPIPTIRELMPNSYAWLMEIEPRAFDIVTFEGRNYGLPRINLDGLYNFAPFWRQDWLISAGFEPGVAPRTLDEFETAFRHFRHGDPDGDGLTNTFALSNMGMNPIFGAFGALPDVWVEDGAGNLIYGAVHPGMRDALELLARWYAEGLIDPEFITGENQGGNWAWSVPFESGHIGFSSSGAFYHINPMFFRPDGSMHSNYGRTIRYLDQVQAGYYEDVILIGYNPIGPNGHHGNILWTVTGGDSIVFGHHLANEPARLARIMEVLDAINADYDTWWTVRQWDLQRYMYDHIPGLGYIPHEGHTRVSPAGHANMFNSLQNPFFAARFREYLYGWVDTKPMFRTGGHANRLMIVTDSMPRYWASLETFRLVSYMQIIRGEHPIEFFDNFVTQWNAMGGATITNEANAWFAGIR